MKVTAVQMHPGDILGIPGDLHFDRQDQPAIEVMLKVFEDVGVTDVDLVGDTFESAGISRHPKLRRARNFRAGKATIKAERDAAADTLKALRNIVQTNRRTDVLVHRGGTEPYTYYDRPGGLHVLTGNHEKWWEDVQDDYPGLMDTLWYELYGDLFDGWHVHAEGTSLKHGPLLVCHGHRLRGSLSKHSAAAVLGNYPGQNTLYGHTHRIDECTTPTHKYGVPSAHGAWTIGHLKDRDAELESSEIGPHSEKHQQGFALVHYFDRDGALGFDVTKVRIHRDVNDKPMCVVGGKVYR